ncbi:hypothetical protein EG329_010792 [Mollisiaceae sp. DMI_Dod_QoI]|nr:hypothetical protein EG329_010792 [Helotiales sp. DMI_Dod_QoI]
MDGYAKISHLMSNHHELAIFRRFDRLAIQNLLYLQAKLTYLENDLQTQVTLDKDDPCHRNYSKDWWSLAKSQHDHEKRQWKKSSHLFKLHGPKFYDLEFFRRWLERPAMGNFPLRGPDQHSWSSEHTEDLLCLQQRESLDPFSRWITFTFIPFFHNAFGKRFRRPISEDLESGICEYSDKHISGFVKVMGTVVSSVLPIGSIMALYFVKSVLVRLGLMAVFTALFSLAMAVFSGAKRVEIFAAASAFAAVQVVFLTSTSPITNLSS